MKGKMWHEHPATVGDSPLRPVHIDEDMYRALEEIARPIPAERPQYSHSTLNAKSGAVYAFLDKAPKCDLD